MVLIVLAIGAVYADSSLAIRKTYDFPDVRAATDYGQYEIRAVWTYMRLLPAGARE